MILFTKFRGRFIVVVLVLYAVVTAVGRAQYPPRNVTAHIQDSVFVGLIVPGVGDTVSPFDFWATYSFENTYADSGNVFFSFTETQVNGQRIELENWKPFEFIKDSTASALSSISRTRVFTVAGGDTISYYRAFDWQNPNDFPFQQASNFYSEDNLEYVIRLRKASNDVELAVLDSIGVLAQNPSGSPTFYGTGLPMAVRQYVVPGGSGGDVYISIDVRADGDGEFYTCRSDQVTGRMSVAVTNPILSEYFAELTGVAPKRLSEKLEELRVMKSEGASLKVVPNPSTSGDVRVIASARSTGERRSILVFSIDGRVIYSYSTVPDEDNLEIAVNVPDPGSYYVVSMVGSEIVGMELLNVVR